MNICFCAPYSSPWVYTCVFISLPYYFDYCSFVVSFKVRKFESSNFVLLFQIDLTICSFSNWFDYLGSLDIPYEFYDKFLYFYKKSLGFDRDCIISVYYFEWYSIKPSNPWKWDIFLFTYIFFNSLAMLHIALVFIAQIFYFLGYFLIIYSFWWYCKWNCFYNFFRYSLLVYRNATYFCIDFYSATLLNFLSCNSCSCSCNSFVVLVESLEFSTMRS